MLAIPNARTAQEMIDAARRRFPKISADGIMLACRDAIHQAIVLEQVERAVEFLQHLEPTKTPRVCSYQLKHACEDWGGGYISNHNELSHYVSNGALITAALSLGLAVQAAGPWWLKNPNCMIGVGIRSVRRVAAIGAIDRGNLPENGKFGRKRGAQRDHTASISADLVFR